MASERIPVIIEYWTHRIPVRRIMHEGVPVRDSVQFSRNTHVGAIHDTIADQIRRLNASGDVKYSFDSAVTEHVASGPASLNLNNKSGLISDLPCWRGAGHPDKSVHIRATLITGDNFVGNRKKSKRKNKRRLTRKR